MSMNDDIQFDLDEKGDFTIITGTSLSNENKEQISRSSDMNANVSVWSSYDNKVYTAVPNVCEILPPDVYELSLIDDKPFFYKVDFSTEDLVNFDDSVVGDVVKDIKQFWQSKEKFIQFGLPYKRGILLYGPPGGGKTTTAKLIVKNLIESGGIAIKFTNHNVFTPSMRILRTVQPDTPVLCIMEDIESMLQGRQISGILNLLDGVNGFENIVYLATTNYPEELEGRFKNRPSRFDRRYNIDYPNKKSREQYIHHLLSKVSSSNSVKIDVDRWVRDTTEFTPAHIKELFISVVLFNNDYNESLETLREMGKNITSDEAQYQKLGFGR